MYQKTLIYIKNILNYKIVKYAMIGIISTLIHISIASLYIYSMNNSLLQSNIIGFLSAYIFSYLMQSTHVFNQSISWVKAFKYFLVQFSSLLASIFISSLFENFDSYVKTILVVIFMPILTFIIHKSWTFKVDNNERK